jgi:transposase
VLQESIEAVRLAEQRLDRVDGHLRAQIPSWSLFPLVQNLCALRGVDAIAGAGMAAAIGDPARFATAPDFMVYLGLVPSEHSSGQRRRIPRVKPKGRVCHHQVRRHPCPHHADRGSAQLPPSGPHRAAQAEGRRSGA